MWDLRRAADRYRTEQPGITTWHSFSSGAHYDSDNLSFGPILACDEHRLDPGAGFDTHPHANLEIISWVLEGELQHEDDAGRSRVIRPGQAQYQRAGHGIRHSERNASDTEPLHFIQFWLLTDEELPDYDVGAPPLRLTVGKFWVVSHAAGFLARAPRVHAYVAAGEYEVDGRTLGPGNSLRLTNTLARIAGEGQLLVLSLDARH